MENIVITKDNKIIAHHTTDSPMSSYGQPVWVVENKDPGPGVATWKQGDNQVTLNILGVIGGFLVASQPDGLLCGIIWSDGNYYANLIVVRDCDLPARKDVTIHELANGKFQVRGTVVIGAFEDESPLGCRFCI